MIEKLRTLSLFQNMNDSFLSEIYTFSKIKSYPKDFILFYEGQKIEQFLFLLSGAVSIDKFDRFGNKKYLYSIHSTHDDHDDFSLINDIDFEEIKTFGNASILEDSEILSIDAKKLLEAAKREVTFFQNLTKQIIFKNQILNQIINRDIIFDAMAKLAYMLDKYLYRFNSTQRQEIAHQLNIQPETLSRILKKLKQDEIIGTDDGGNVTIVDKIRLQEIYKI
ncbi:hypothetical protein BKH41_05920 [Helicobacter sp. 12S02232-10]|uniref:Crp/Fnr family transcriptional regulator n=1 Tax=Helicobacter sp. 12S02232-10 TaxID=1476197 RepID=UPI000BCF9244|nr:Crp/Fnr family transcriptional regulator [Helicobacter sp. 12S02232-10]PAF48249.1 hypothetical protein BKH41_05920 [Helicobacter sp. 12S02232-10]